MPILKNIQGAGNSSCDMCRKTIFGDRFHCLQCPDWDACPPCAPRFTGQLHDANHRFLFVPASGKYIHYIRGVQLRVCKFCRKGVKTQEGFACLECEPLLQTCIDGQAGRESHRQTTGHLFVIERQGDLICDGCSTTITDWWKCLTCPDVGFCAVCVLPHIIFNILAIIISYERLGTNPIITHLGVIHTLVFFHTATNDFGVVFLKTVVLQQS